MKTETKHTPTPWKNEKGFIWSKEIDGFESAVRFDKANRDFIVRAVNSHEELLEAARESLNLLHAELDAKIQEQYPETDSRIKVASVQEKRLWGLLAEAIAKAEAAQ